ncbi:1294_t:CDS:2 [Cetraspora pellucida]|uniref:1294_t:CDS:1 n=1 Tax=Cetraspora pellucida TaxID=1433469 RepID=A0A9N8WB08_9GLOM|nr:1294_t:CDS:2 [Cetraspora pellucida]
MQDQRDKSKDLSELDLLRQRIIDPETENAKLKADNAKLKQTLKEHEIRITNLEQRDKEKTVTNMQNDLSAKDISYEINSNNTPKKIIDISDNASNSDDIQSKIVMWKNLIPTYWYKDVKKLENIVDHDRRKRCQCQLNGVYLIEVWYKENPEVTIPQKIYKYRECIIRKTFDLTLSQSLFYCTQLRQMESPKQGGEGSRQGALRLKVQDSRKVKNKGYIDLHHEHYLLECISAESNVDLTIDSIQQALKKPGILKLLCGKIVAFCFIPERSLRLNRKVKNVHDAIICIFSSIFFSDLPIDQFTPSFAQQLHRQIGNELINNAGSKTGDVYLQYLRETWYQESFNPSALATFILECVYKTSYNICVVMDIDIQD